VVGLGASLGDRATTLEAAVRLLAVWPGIVVERSSRVYWSAPAGGVGPVKRMVLSADLTAARRSLPTLLGSSSASVRGELESLVRKLNIAV